ncbi:MAG: ATP synthase F1 subunit delta [Candidatus Melainabacteria bacterium GWF2_37_15]|nr:MAG: ATP synthase F1 subunit delta [Candidatus Melainabacteria bacterium GWF2_37_15]
MNEGLSIIADKYADAMIQLAEKNDLLDTINADLHLIKDTVKSNKDLQDFIEHPLINAEEKKEVMETIFKPHINLMSMNLIKLMADNNRLFLLSFVAECYNKILSEIRNIETAQVITAIEIDEDTKNRVKERLEKLFSKQIKIESYIDKQIIAGMIVKVKDKIIDGSIRTKFENMKKEVAGYGKH